MVLLAFSKLLLFVSIDLIFHVMTRPFFRRMKGAEMHFPSPISLCASNFYESGEVKVFWKKVPMDVNAHMSGWDESESG